MKKLYKLVHAMTPVERRYFISYTKNNDTKKQLKYLSLFDTLCKAGAQDKRELTEGQFSYSDRNLLWEKLLEALHVFHGRRSVDAEIRLLLSQAAILYKKNIWDEMDKQLKKAKKMAIENERLLALLEITQLQKDVALARTDVLFSRALTQERTSILKQLIEQTDYELKREKVIITINSIDMTREEKIRNLETFSDPPMLPALSASSTVLSKIDYHCIKFICQEFFGDEQRIFHAKKLLEICQNVIYTNDSNWIIYVYVYMLSYSKKVSGKEINLSEVLNNIPVKNDGMLYFLYAHDIQKYTQYAPDKVRGEAIIEKIKAKNYISHVHIYGQIRLIYMIMCFYGTFDNWQQADIWFRELSSIRRPGIQRSVQVCARVYSLMIRYEMDDVDADIHIQSVQKYLKRNKLYSELEKNILEIFNRLYEATLPNDKVVLWKELYDILDASTNQVHIPFVELKQWCKSKINGINIAELIGRKQAEGKE